jgi:LuxR family transcriptional regulator, maltose regulon positive regulatory protein
MADNRTALSTPSDTTTTEELLAEGWQALARTEWERGRSLFEAAAGRDESAEALEGLSLAAWWLDDAETMFSMRERAYRLYRRDGDVLSAGRLATLFGIDYFSFRGEAAIGNGWFRRAHRLLEGLPPVPEHGWLWIWEGQIRLLEDNDPATARRLAQQGAELGRDLGDPDIEMTGLGLEGLAAVTAGEISEGMAKLDEATAAAVGGEMSLPIGMGATCCYLIFACERARDFDRAGQWCRRVQELCLQWRWVSLFSTCRTHYASVLLSQGAWKEAEAELEAATRELEATRPGKVTDGIVRLAELRRRQGRLEEADRLLERISFSPHALFGLAALAFDRGQAADALDLIDRFLRQIPIENRTDRAAAFELAVRAHAALGQADAGRAPLVELEALADAVATDPMRASVALARGVLARAAGEYAEGRRHLEDAVDLFQRCRLPFESAQARLELAQVLVELGRDDLALREARSAEAALLSVGAGLAARRAGALLRELGASPTRPGRGEPTFGLSARELEVLALVAQGHRNQQIAKMLVLSEHTVRRHVANILKKMGVPSRTAAAALATRENLL